MENEYCTIAEKTIKEKTIEQFDIDQTKVFELNGEGIEVFLGSAN